MKDQKLIIDGAYSDQLICNTATKSLVTKQWGVF